MCFFLPLFFFLSSSVSPSYFSFLENILTSMLHRFYYLASAFNFSAPEQEAISNFKISDLIFNTTNISRMQCSAFYASTSRLECSSSTEPLVPQQQLLLLDGRLDLRWNISQDQVITLQVTANTTGWVAIGMNKTI